MSIIYNGISWVFGQNKKRRQSQSMQTVTLTNHEGKYDESAEHLGYVDYSREKSLCAKVLVSSSLQCPY
jgi:hypothetical protein